MLKNSPKLLTGILQKFGIVHFLLALGFDFLFCQKRWLFAYFFIPVKIAVRAVRWRLQMCIMQHLKVISSLAKGLLQRADEKCADLWGPREESENWLLVQVNYCHPTEACAASGPWVPTHTHWACPCWACLSCGLQWRVLVWVAQLWTHVVSCLQVLCLGFPVSIFFIVINEFCERFSYYGMKGMSLVSLCWALPRPDSVCNLLLCCSSYSCAHFVFHTFPTLGWQLCHCHLPHVCCSVLLDANPWSNHCGLLAGKV